MRVKLSVLVSLFVSIIVIAAACSLVETGGDTSEQGNNLPTAVTSDGTLIIALETNPLSQPGVFQFTGVPTGTIQSDGTLVVANLSPGTYTTTEVDPAPDFDLTVVECDDGDSATPSSGDAQTRTAVFNLDSNETITCTFINTQRGSLVVAGQTIPDGANGTFQFTGVPTGTIPSNGTLVVANLTPGTYSTTERDPAPDFDLTAVECDDSNSQSRSSGDAQTRTAIYNLDPGEQVTCTFTNTQRGSLVVSSQTIPDSTDGTFQFTGVPSGTVSTNSTIVVADLTPGSYTTTEIDPAPDFDLTAVECDDGDSTSPSDGDPLTRTAIFNLDPGETVACNFIHTALNSDGTPIAGSSISGSGGDGNVTGGEVGDDADGRNPFENPGDDLVDFPLPEELPPGAGTFTAPKPGPWAVTHFAGQMNCDTLSLAIPASPQESGIIEVLDGGQTLIGTGLESANSVSITLTAARQIRGRYTGSIQGLEQGVPVTINYFWQVVTDEYIVGYLTSSVTSEGINCSVYRAFEMVYSG